MDRPKILLLAEMAKKKKLIVVTIKNVLSNRKQLLMRMRRKEHQASLLARGWRWNQRRRKRNDKRLMRTKFKKCSKIYLKEPNTFFKNNSTKSLFTIIFSFFSLRVLVSSFSEEQLNRYEMYRRSAFPKAAIKRVSCWQILNKVWLKCCILGTFIWCNTHSSWSSPLQDHQFLRTSSLPCRVSPKFLLGKS